MNSLEGARVLVIGGAGFVGSHIVDQLLDEPVAAITILDNFVRGRRANIEAATKDTRVTVTEGSITDIDLLHDLMRGHDYVFHLAALWLWECVHEPRAALDVNVVGTYNVIEAAAATGIKKLIYSSSASVYGDAVFTPMTEEHPFNNRTMYGATKVAGEQFLRAFYDQSGLNYTGMRYMNIYGPRMDYKGTYVSVIMKVLDRIDQGLPPIVFGDGSQAYDFVHVSDVARANILALKSDATDEVFNVATGKKTSINELVTMLLEITGSSLDVDFRPQEQSFVSNRLGCVEKGERLLGFKANISLEDGLRSVVAWRERDKQDLPRELAEPSNLKIPITKPEFGRKEFEAIQKPLKSGWVVQGPYVKQFEDRFAEFAGAKHAVATSSCTTSLHTAVAALGLSAGDEVIVPAFTWIATANVVEYMGARPVFCDIDLSTFNIDVDQIESLITPRTVGILPVHLFGLCADMHAITGIAAKNNLWVVEDCACAFGAYIGNRHAGTFGNAGCFSFHPRKSITSGEGGMLTTADDQLAQLARSLRDHGGSKSDLARHESAAGYLLPDYPHLGYNYRMTDFQGALGCAQMDRGQSILNRRADLASRYNRMLPDLDLLRAPTVPENYTHGYQSYVTLYAPEFPTLDNVARLGIQRNEMMAELERNGITTRQGTHAAALQRYYADKYGLHPADFPRAHLAENLSITLPLYPQMKDDELRRVCESLAACVGVKST